MDKEKVENLNLMPIFRLLLSRYICVSRTQCLHIFMLTLIPSKQYIKTYISRLLTLRVFISQRNGKFLKFFSQKFYLYAILDNEKYYKFYCFSFVEL